MVTQELSTYLQNELQNGVSPEVITAHLLTQGYSQEDILAGLHVLAKEPPIPQEINNSNAITSVTTPNATGPVALPYVITPQETFTIIFVLLGSIITFILLTILQRGLSAVPQVFGTLCILWLILGSFIVWIRSKKILLSSTQITYGKQRISYSEITSVRLDTSRGGPIISISGQTSSNVLFSLKPFSKNDAVMLLTAISQNASHVQFDDLSTQILHNQFKTVDRRLLTSVCTYSLPILVLLYGTRLLFTMHAAMQDCSTNPNVRTIFCKKQVEQSTFSKKAVTTISSQTSQWSTYTAVSNFSILFPGAPQHTTKAISVPSIAQPLTAETYTSDFHLLPDQTVYQVTIVTYPSLSIGFLQPTTYFPKAISGDVQSFPGNVLVSSQLGAFQGFPSADYVIHNPQTHAYTINKLLLINNYVYSLRAIAGTVTPPDYTTFIQSFHYLGH